MKIKLLKDHLDNKKEDVIDVTEQRGQYLIRVGVGIKSEPKTEFKEPFRKAGRKTKR
jgi:hypothetical protein